MADYGNDATVENDSYCLNSFQKRNVAEMNAKMGYNDMSDRANTPKPPVQMKTAKSNVQLSGRLPNGK